MLEYYIVDLKKETITKEKYGEARKKGVPDGAFKHSAFDDAWGQYIHYNRWFITQDPVVLKAFCNEYSRRKREKAFIAKQGNVYGRHKKYLYSFAPWHIKEEGIGEWYKPDNRGGIEADYYSAFRWGKLNPKMGRPRLDEEKKPITPLYRYLHELDAGNSKNAMRDLQTYLRRYQVFPKDGCIWFYADTDDEAEALFAKWKDVQRASTVNPLKLKNPYKHAMNILNIKNQGAYHRYLSLKNQGVR